MTQNTCKECGCACKFCTVADQDIHLHMEIESLHQKLQQREAHIVSMETKLLSQPSVEDCDELTIVKNELLIWQDKYKRLYDAHKRVQRVNQGLEDKLLRLVDVSETEKCSLTSDVSILSKNLAEANYSIKKLTESNERYKEDVTLAIQFLHCKQANFVAHKFDSLPPELQSRVSAFMAQKKKPEERKPIEPKSIKVPIPTFPPTAMVYSIPKAPSTNPLQSEESPPIDIVSAAIMAKVLEERYKERLSIKHCDTCTCAKDFRMINNESTTHNGTQTELPFTANGLCSTDFQEVKQTIKMNRNADIANNRVPHFSNESDFSNNVVKVQPNNCLLEKSSSNASSLVDINFHLESSDFSTTDQSIVITKSKSTEIFESVSARFPPEQSQDIFPPKGNRSISGKYRSSEMFPKLPILTIENDKISKKMIKNDSSSTFNHFNKISSIVPTHKLEGNKPKSNNILVVSSKADKPPPDEATGSLVAKNSIINISSEEELEPNISLSLDEIKVRESTATTAINEDRDVDKAKYAEMEENVKKFLFGERTLYTVKTEYTNQNFDTSNDHSTQTCLQTDLGY